VIDMDERRTLRDDQLGYTSHGASIYITLAGEAGINPVEAIKAMPSMLSAAWIDAEHFLAALGKNDIRALISARSHFGLPPVE
jgi:hypothetical protein